MLSAIKRVIARVTGTLAMFDDTSVALLPRGRAAYAGYVGGSWPTFRSLRRMFPKAHLVSIAVNAGERAKCLDIETGDATISEAPTWVLNEHANGNHRPWVYTQASNLSALEATLAHAGIPRSHYVLWSAHYGSGKHFCGPHTCGFGLSAADATQWSDNALGRSLDQSIVRTSCFRQPPAPRPRRPVTVYTADGSTSLEALSASASVKLPVSTILRLTVQHFGAFSPELSAYLQAGDLSKPVPAGVRLVT